MLDELYNKLFAITESIKPINEQEDEDEDDLEKEEEEFEEEKEDEIGEEDEDPDAEPEEEMTVDDEESAEEDFDAAEGSEGIDEPEPELGGGAPDAEETGTEPEAEPEEESEEAQIEKQYLGKKDDDTYYYLNKIEGGWNVTDAEGKIVYPLKGEAPEVPENDVVGFIIQAQRDLELEEISGDIFKRYFEPALEEEEEVRDEEAGIEYEGEGEEEGGEEEIDLKDEAPLADEFGMEEEKPMTIESKLKEWKEGSTFTLGDKTYKLISKKDKGDHILYRAERQGGLHDGEIEEIPVSKPKTNEAKYVVYYRNIDSGERGEFKPIEATSEKDAYAKAEARLIRDIGEEDAKHFEMMRVRIVGEDDTPERKAFPSEGPKKTPHPAQARFGSKVSNLSKGQIGQRRDVFGESKTNESWRDDEEEDIPVVSHAELKQKLRQQEAEKMFGKDWEELDTDEQKAVDDTIWIRKPRKRTFTRADIYTESKQSSSPSSGTGSDSSGPALNETVSELIHEVPGIDEVDQMVLEWAIGEGIVPNKFPDPFTMLMELDEVVDDEKDGEEVDALIDAMHEGGNYFESVMHLQIYYLKKILLPKARDAYTGKKKVKEYKMQAEQSNSDDEAFIGYMSDHLKAYDILLKKYIQSGKSSEEANNMAFQDILDKPVKELKKIIDAESQVNESKSLYCKNCDHVISKRAYGKYDGLCGGCYSEKDKEEEDKPMKCKKCGREIKNEKGKDGYCDSCGKDEGVDEAVVKEGRGEELFAEAVKWTENYIRQKKYHYAEAEIITSLKTKFGISKQEAKNVLDTARDEEHLDTSEFSMDESKMNEGRLVRAFDYKGYKIRVDAVDTRFGTLYRSSNDIGEPDGDNTAYSSIEKAIEVGKYDVDMYIKGIEESKMNEVKFIFDRHNFNVELTEDNENGITINVNDKQKFNFTPHFANLYRDEKGQISEDSLVELAKSALSNLSEEYFEELAKGAVEQGVEDEENIKGPEEPEPNIEDEPVEESKNMKKKVNEGLGGDIVGPITVSKKEFLRLVRTLDEFSDISKKLAQLSGEANKTFVVTDGDYFIGIDPQGYDYARYKTPLCASDSEVAYAAKSTRNWRRKSMDVPYIDELEESKNMKKKNESIIPNDEDSEEKKIEKLTEAVSYSYDDGDYTYTLIMSEKGKPTFSIDKEGLTLISGEYSGAGVTSYKIVEEETLVNALVDILSTVGEKKGYLDKDENESPNEEVEESKTDKQDAVFDMMSKHFSK